MMLLNDKMSKICFLKNNIIFFLYDMEKNRLKYLLIRKDAIEVSKTIGQGFLRSFYEFLVYFSEKFSDFCFCIRIYQNVIIKAQNIFIIIMRVFRIY